MEAALTFGSVGDIIAVCELAYQLYHALQGNSAKEFQALIRDLNTFISILMHVIETFEQREESPWLTGLGQASKSIVDECATAIGDMINRIQPRYEGSLGPEASESSTGRIKQAYRKLEWSVKEKERVGRLNDLLEKNIQTLTLLVAMATSKSNRVDRDTLLARVAVVDRRLGEAQAHGDEMLRILRDHSKAQDRQQQALININNELQEQSRKSSQFAGALQLIFTGICDIGNRVGQLTQAIITLQMSLTDLRPLDPTREQPVILEDSLGRMSTIPADWLQSLRWETLHSLIEGKFEGDKGQTMVRNREYLLEEGVSGRDLERHRPLSTLLRRGMKINMSMQFYNMQPTPMVTGACPGCQQVTGAAEGVTIKCETEGCGLFFKLQVFQAEPTQAEQAEELPGRQGVFQEEQVNDVNRGVRASPADFRRVRILHVHLPHLNQQDSGLGDADGKLTNVEDNDASGLLSVPTPEGISVAPAIAEVRELRMKTLAQAIAEVRERRMKTLAYYRHIFGKDEIGESLAAEWSDSRQYRRGQKGAPRA